MTNQLVVNVTKQHINAGIPESECSCPIAKALRPLANKKRVEVTGDEAIIGNRIYVLPRIARQFIQMFDSGKKVKPISFSLQQLVEVW